MGMFDTIRFDCPFCGGIIEEQSKAGDCLLLTHISEDGVPPEIARSLDGETVHCFRCKGKFKVKSDEIKTVHLELVEST